MVAALLGAAVGGVASLGGSVVVDRMRLRRETRVRIYDEYIGEAIAALGRWLERSDRGGIDLENNAALLALAQVRRASVIAGRTDRQQTDQWQSAYDTLCDLSIQIAHLGRPPDPDERDKLLKEVAKHSRLVMQGLRNYLEWLQRRLS